MTEINLLLINGSPHGSSGNTSVLLDLAVEKVSSQASITRLDLSEEIEIAKIEILLQRASGFILGTGTYWDSWGSPLQKFFEDMTSTEGSKLWLGKPAAVIVTMHSVGGKGVLSRLQGVLNTFGVLIPPMSGLVYSAANQLALKQDDTKLAEDFWRPQDVEVICHNLVQACLGKNNWITWPFDGTSFDEMWLER